MNKKIVKLIFTYFSFECIYRSLMYTYYIRRLALVVLNGLPHRSYFGKFALSCTNLYLCVFIVFARLPVFLAFFRPFASASVVFSLGNNLFHEKI